MMGYEPAPYYSAQDYHKDVVSTFKKALSTWDWNNNPLEWEGLPEQFLEIASKIYAGAIPASYEQGYGAPFTIKFGDYSGEPFELHLSKEAIVQIEISQFPLCDGDDMNWIGLRYPLSETMIMQCAKGDEGWELAHQIAALEKSITEVKRKAAELGWDLTDGTQGEREKDGENSPETRTEA